jgi:hypothetical protein
MLILILHIFIGATLSGIAVIVALLMGASTLTPILIAAAIGFIAAFPVAYLMAARMSQ